MLILSWIKCQESGDLPILTPHKFYKIELYAFISEYIGMPLQRQLK